MIGIVLKANILWANDSWEVQQDLSNQIYVYQQSQELFIPYQKQIKSNAQHLFINLKYYSGRYLEISAKQNTAIFADNLFQHQQLEENQIYAIDSLRKVWGKEFALITLYHRNLSAREVSLRILKKKQVGDEEDIYNWQVERKRESSEDFFIISFLLVLIFFASLFATNPKLVIDYFNVLKVFTVRDREESTQSLKLTSPLHLLMYALFSMVVALFIFISFSGNPQIFSPARYFGTDTFTEMVLTWSLVAMVIYSLLVLKLFVLFMLTSLFDLRNFLSIHYFNFIRLSILVTGLALSILFLLTFSIDNIEWIYLPITLFLNISFGAWLVLLFLKLISRGEFRISYLFSYLCASEIIPFLLIIKVFYF